MSRTLLLIDLSGIFWACWHATADQALSEAHDRTIARVHTLRRDYDLAVCCVDAPPYWRKELLPQYKAQRDAPEPQAIDQFRRVKERLAADGVLLWGVKGFEADDVAATATTLAIEAGLSVVLASSDKDWLQLVNDRTDVRVLSTSTNVMYDCAAVVAKCGVGPDLMTDWLALVGDASDNVPGVPKVGPKTAAELLRKWGSLDDVLFNADKNTPKLMENLITHGEAARLARRIVTLRTDVPLAWDELFQERQAEPLTTKDYEDEGFERDEDEEDDVADLISGPKPAPEPKNAAPPKSEPPPAPKSEPRPVEPVEPAVMTRPTTAIVVPQGPQVSWDLQLEPRTIDGAFKLARGLHESRLYASKFSNPEAIMTVMIRGREMGIPALVALDVFHFFEGKLALHAHLIVARAQAMPECEYFSLVSSSDQVAEYVTKHRRNPEPTRLRYSLEQAKRAGLCPENPRPRPPGGDKDRRGNWEKRPDEMLRKTCATQLIRIVYPDAALGIYAVEELEGRSDEEAA